MSPIETTRAIPRLSEKTRHDEIGSFGADEIARPRGSGESLTRGRSIRSGRLLHGLLAVEAPGLPGVLGPE